jgi:hypothetical protein
MGTGVPALLAPCATAHPLLHAALAALPVDDPLADGLPVLVGFGATQRIRARPGRKGRLIIIGPQGIAEADAPPPQAALPGWTTIA